MLSQVRTQAATSLSQRPRGSAYHAEFVSSRRQVDSEMRAARLSLPEACRTYTAAFLAASASNGGWIPRLCVVNYRDKLVGFVCAKEKTVAGFRTGLIYGDSVLGNLVISESDHQEGVLSASLEKFLALPRTRGLRISIPAGGYEQGVISRLVSSTPVDAGYRPITNHSTLPLAPTYEAFLETLGRHTRRNFRVYRRKFEATGNTCVETMTFADFKSAAEELLQKKVVGASLRGVKRALAILGVVDRPLLTGLRTKEGTWLSILGGWYSGSDPLVFMQMNDERDHAESSLALVLRSYLIEKIIGEGATSLIFWAGVGGPIAKYATALPTTAVYLDKTHLGWRMFRRGVASIRAHLPLQAMHMTEWVVPSSDIGCEV
jgi:hypothetical protein